MLEVKATLTRLMASSLSRERESRRRATCVHVARGRTCVCVYESCMKERRNGRGDMGDVFPNGVGKRMC